MHLNSELSKSWQQAKVDIAAGRTITNVDVLKKLIQVYNREKGRKVI